MIKIRWLDDIGSQINSAKAEGISPKLGGVKTFLKGGLFCLRLDRFSTMAVKPMHNNQIDWIMQKIMMMGDSCECI